MDLEGGGLAAGDEDLLRRIDGYGVDALGRETAT
jgi:hypothetical protein